MIMTRKPQSLSALVWLASFITVCPLEKILGFSTLTIPSSQVWNAMGIDVTKSGGKVLLPTRTTGRGSKVRNKCLVQRAGRIDTQLSASIPLDVDFPSMLNAFDTFDGSAVVDTVVVSGAFWSTLGTKILFIILGQVLSTILFTVAVSFAASQLTGVINRATKNLVETFLGPPPKLRRPVGAEGKPTMDLQKLALCVAIDVLGSASELLPIVGEVTDVIYAPIAATLLRSLYGSNVVFLLEFVEEILPFTDIIPLATICWFVDTLAPGSGLAKFLLLGDYRRNASSDLVDVTPPALNDDNRNIR